MDGLRIHVIDQTRVGPAATAILSARGNEERAKMFEVMKVSSQ
jgi:hypothetical protein